MKDFEIIEGTAGAIEHIAALPEMESYRLESIQYTHRAFIMDDSGTISADEVNWYSAVFRLRPTTAKGHA